MTRDQLILRLSEIAEWADGDEWGAPLDMAGTIRAAMVELRDKGGGDMSSEQRPSWADIIRKFKEVCMEEKKIITLGDILDLLGPDDTEITVHEPLGDDSLTGPADCSLWTYLENMPVYSINVDGSGLEVWLNDTE